ncbi:MAG: alcohol dehydrogenase catalytic domain-containing protein [Pseudomonadota bacterium]
MKALVYTGPEALEYRDVADPVASDGEVMVQVESVGICGSDMHAFLGHDERRPAPLILGHEVSGTLTSGPNSGQRVTVNPLVTCGHCKACVSGRDNLCPDRQIISMQPREGGFAEQLTIPERNVVALPQTVSSDQAALTEPIACGWHAVRIAKTQLQNSNDAQALVMGGGAIGLGAALSLKAQGIGDVLIIEPNAGRRTYLEETCGQKSCAPEALGDTQFFDIIVDGVGIEASRAQASAHATPGGVIVHIGLGSSSGGLDVRRMTLQEIAFIGTYTYTAQDFRDTAQAMFDGRLGALNWTQDWPLENGQAAFQAIRSGEVAAPKIILKPNI